MGLCPFGVQADSFTSLLDVFSLFLQSRSMRFEKHFEKHLEKLLYQRRLHTLPSRACQMSIKRAQSYDGTIKHERRGGDAGKVDTGTRESVTRLTAAHTRSF